MRNKKTYVEIISYLYLYSSLVHTVAHNLTFSQVNFPYSRANFQDKIPVEFCGDDDLVMNFHLVTDHLVRIDLVTSQLWKRLMDVT